MDLKEAVRGEARRLGFTGVGFASSGRHPAAARLREWLERGFAADMTWMHRREAERGNPARLIPWARTLIVAALPYSSDLSGEIPPSQARISRYARGGDYHDVLKERLARLGSFLSRVAPGARSCPVVDTGAILEKAWACTAGLGWQGKHTNLIAPEAGSFFFLGELATDLELAADTTSITDRCGACTLCLDACPTQAFPEPYVLDARRCISYLTIEHRGAVPEELRERFGNRVFGCDVCQEVCPWNGDAAPGDPRLEDHAPAPDLVDLIGLDREEFQRRFAATPLRRAGWLRFLRNVAVALGNSQDPRAVPALRAALAIPDPLLQEHVRWALTRLGAGGRPEAPRGEEAPR
jgi:epoxyqueuosine reductase